MEQAKSGESSAFSGEESYAKRRREDVDPNVKSVVVLLDSDVYVRENGQVFIPNTIEMANLKKKEKGQYRRIKFTSEMTEKDVLGTLHYNFSILRNKKRLGCASAVENQTRLEFHGEPRLWNGALIEKLIRGDSALYLLAEQVMEQAKSGESSASSGEESNAKRRWEDVDRNVKGVVVLLDSDVYVSENGQVFMPNTIEMAKLKKPEKGQYHRIKFTSEMTEKDVLSTLHCNFSILKNKRRLGCASAVENRTRLEFHGEPRLWNGALIKKLIRGNSALYLLAEGSRESEESQVLPIGTVSVAATRPLNVNTSVAGPSQQKKPVLIVPTRQKDLSVPAAYSMNSATQMNSIPLKRCLGQDMTARKRTAQWRSFSQQSTTVSTSKKQENGTSSFATFGSPGCSKSAENLAFQAMQHRFTSSATSTEKSSLQVRGLASEPSVNEDSMTTPVQHHCQADLSMPTSVAQGSVLAATQRLKELSADQGHLTGKGDALHALVSNANHLSALQKTQNDPVVQTISDPAAQESPEPVSTTSDSQQRELNACSSEQGLSPLQQVLPTTYTQKLSENEGKRKSPPHGHQENLLFRLLLAMSDGETPDSAIDSMLEESNESDHDTGQSGGIVEEISPNKGSTKGGDKFHIILRDIVPLDIDSCVACFQNCGTVHLKQTNPFTLTGSTPSPKGPGLVNVTLMSVDGSWTGGKTKFLYADLFTKEELLNQLVMDTDMQSKMFHWMYKGMSYPSDLQTSNPSGKALPGSSGVDHSRHARSVRVLQFLVYKAAQIGGHEFIQMIFRTSAGKVVFNNYKNSATLPEDVARTNGHKIVADHLQDVNNRLSEESNSDAGTETIDWLELKRAVDKEQSLPCTDDAQMLKNCQPQSPESDYNGSDYLADDEMSACSSPSHSEVSDTEHEDHNQNTIRTESWSEKEVNEEINLPVEKDDSSLLPLHLVGNQLEVIPCTKDENAGYEHKQLDSDEEESHRSEDDINEKEYECTGFKTDQNELIEIAVPCGGEVANWDTLGSEEISTIKEASTGSSHTAALPNIYSHQEPDDDVETNGSETGLDGDQKEFKMIDNDEISRSRAGKESSSSCSTRELPCSSELRDARRSVFPDSKLSDVLKRHPDFLDQLALCLDRNMGLIPNWKQLAKELYVDEDVIKKLEQYENQSPTIRLFEYLEVTQPQLTIQQLRNAMLEIGRNDLFSLLTKGGFAGSERVQEVMTSQPHSPSASLLVEIALALDAMSPLLANWYQLALKLGVPRKDCWKLERSSTQSPTKEMFQYLEANHPQITLKKVKEILHSIGRNDLLYYLTNQGLEDGVYLKDVMTPGSELLQTMADKLDLKILTLTDWHNLACKLYLPVDMPQASHESGQKRKSPTKEVLQWLVTRFPDTILKDVVKALDKIQRNDAIQIITRQFPDTVESSLERLDSSLHDVPINDPTGESWSTRYKRKECVSFKGTPSEGSDGGNNKKPISSTSNLGASENADEADAELFSFGGGSSSAKPSSSTLDREKIYKMDCSTCGIAVIISNKNFPRSSGMDRYPRYGTNVVQDSLAMIFRILKFEVKVYNDCTKTEIRIITKEMAEFNHSIYDAFIFILTHGEEDVIYGTDGTISIRDLIAEFKYSTSLAGKRKIFFVQACSGDEFGLYDATLRS